MKEKYKQVTWRKVNNNNKKKQPEILNKEEV